MSQNFIDIFKANCISLADTVVINHPYAGVVINNRLAVDGFGAYTNSQNRNTWKYYQNMAGIYHPSDSIKIHKINQAKNLGTTPGVDPTKMIIRVASDPNQSNGFSSTVEKEFTVDNISGVGTDENLSLEFQIGTPLYNELLATYPDFEDLIRGVLHPIPLIVSTNADDFAVLYCGGYYRTRLNTLRSEYAFIKGTAPVYALINLIEDWETSLIYELEAFTKIYFKQYSNKVYSEYNDLYLSSEYGIYKLNLPTIIFNIRFDKVKTSEAHSTHVQLYLDSYSGLGQYMSYLTRKQCMYLYQNIEWLACNTGKQKVFDSLVNDFLRDQQVAVIVYDGYHDTTRLGVNDESTPIFIRTYNDIIKLINTKKTWTPAELIALEYGVARDNGKNVEDQVYRASKLTLDATSARFKTKIIETHLSTQILNQYVSREEFFFNNWVYSAVNFEYSGIMTVTLPNTGDNLQLTVKNAMILFYYCYAKAYLNFTPTAIPELQLHHIPKTLSEVGTVDSLKAYRSVKEFTDDELNKLYSYTNAARKYSSTGQFGNSMRAAWNNFIARNYVAHANPFIQASAQIKGMVDRFYLVKKVNIDLGMSYDAWVSGLGNEIHLLDNESLKGLCDSLFTVALDIKDQSEADLTKIHQAMINIVKTFSSYDVQFITQTAAGEVSNLGVNYPRAEHVSTNYSSNDDYHICNYPDYQTTPAQSSIATSRWGFGMVYDSFGKGIHLSQEQLKGLVLTEDGASINLGG